jgi:hypothetical protein
MRRRKIAWPDLSPFLAGLLIALQPGCDLPDKDQKITQLEEKNKQLEETLEAKNQTITQQANTIADQKDRIQTLVALGPDRLKKLYYPTRIVIDPLTGGADYDRKPGDDGVTVYIKPIDEDGDVIKAAGHIYIQLLDLAQPEAKKLIGEYSLDVDHARKQWHGRFLTNHYTVKCPWQPGKGAPEHREITVHVEFMEYLTGTKLTATHTCKISLPPENSQAEK